MHRLLRVSTGYQRNHARAVSGLLSHANMIMPKLLLCCAAYPPRMDRIDIKVAPQAIPHASFARVSARGKQTEVA